MKIARFFACVFACIGMVLLVGSMGFLLLNRNAEVRIRELPQGAVSAGEAFAQALNEGDLEAAAQMMYGQPDLGISDTPEGKESAALWEAFRESITVELTGEWTVEPSALIRTATVTRLDVSTVLGKLPELVQTLMDQKIAGAEDLAEIYDEQNEFRQKLVDEILEEALQQALSQDAQWVDSEVTLKLVNREGRWWVVPHQNLLQILSGLA